MTRQPTRNRNGIATGRFEYGRLEQRNLLANFTVNSIGDDASGIADGVVTLREAVIAAETNLPFGDAMAGDVDGDQIRFDTSLIGETILLTEGEFSISDDLEIFGGNRDITIDADEASRIFNINSAERVLLRDISITNGMQLDAGGAVLFNGTGQLTLNGVAITESQTDDVGGAVAFFGSQLLIRDSDLWQNDAPADLGMGAALYVGSGEARVFESAFAQNIAAYAGGGIAVGDAKLTVAASTIGGGSGEGNSAQLGGGIYAAGFSDSRVTISLSDVSNNSAFEHGGGIWNGAERVMLIRESWVSVNSTVTNFDGVSTDGGGIYNDGGTLRIRKNTLVNLNESGSGDGGGIYSASGLIAIVDSDLVANSAERGNGGGLAVGSGQSFVARANITENAALMGSGGGIYNAAAMNSRSGIQFSTIQNNTASDSGGGIFNGERVRLNIKDSTVAANTAFFGNGGGIHTSDRTPISRSVISDNVTTTGNGGGVYFAAGTHHIGLIMTANVVEGNSANNNGGGIYLGSSNNRFTDTTIRGNTAGFESSDIDSLETGNGGGIYSTQPGFRHGESFFSGGSLDGNMAYGSGGGLYSTVDDAGGNSWDFLDNVIVRQNAAVGDEVGQGGGAIYAKQTTIRLYTSLVLSNTARGEFGSGGAFMAVQGSTIDLLGVTASNNRATVDGGVLASVNSRHKIRSSMLNSNLAFSGSGGALYFEGNDLVGFSERVDVAGTRIASNDAGAFGGGIYWQSMNRSLNIGESILENNDADLGGGGLFFSGTFLNARFTQFLDNSTAGDGGGIYITASTNESELYGVTVSLNDADRGAGIYNNGPLFIDASMISFNFADTAAGGIFDDVDGITTAQDTLFVGNLPE